MTNKRWLLIVFMSIAVLLVAAWADTAWRGVPTVQNSRGFTTAALQTRYPESKHHQARGSSPWPFVVKVESYRSNGEGGEGEYATFLWCFGLMAEMNRHPYIAL